MGHTRGQGTHGNQPVPAPHFRFHSHLLGQVLDYGHCGFDLTLPVADQRGRHGKGQLLARGDAAAVGFSLGFALAFQSLVQGGELGAEHFGVGPSEDPRRLYAEEVFGSLVEYLDAAGWIHCHHRIGHLFEDAAAVGLDLFVGFVQEGVILADSYHPGANGAQHQQQTCQQG